MSHIVSDDISITLDGKEISVNTLNSQNINALSTDIGRRLNKVQKKEQSVLKDQLSLGKRVYIAREYIKTKTTQHWKNFCFERYSRKDKPQLYHCQRNIGRYADFFRDKSEIDQYCDDNNCDQPTSMNAYNTFFNRIKKSSNSNSNNKVDESPNNNSTDPTKFNIILTTGIQFHIIKLMISSPQRNLQNQKRKFI